ncbi:monocarboxylate transporter 12-B [Eurytemora carolleeae]|uniref:monocarboxylate transporter 12-B n=1 Tax=Eurytemora carolleeae TaxID=1294199 RepID=UPI000C767EE1|nr:monocarboxylate transporter 12-B [Eurytemora carolleeae]|eukprot:XP_023326720.1 monocarboxylate transporter 12-B-like [Eurytemora affinis]
MSEKRSRVSIAGSLLVASYAFTGPLASRLVSRFGTRKVCVLGGFLSAVGLAVASAMNSLLGLIATYSIITGFGFGLMYISSIVAVANHFTKKRSLAIGICLCGAGVGTFLLAPLESYLTEAYGRRAAFLCMSGFCLVAMLGGLVMRPVKFVNPVQTEVRRIEEEGPTGLKEKIITLLIDRDLYRSPEFGLFMVVDLC